MAPDPPTSVGTRGRPRELGVVVGLVVVPGALVLALALPRAVAQGLPPLTSLALAAALAASALLLPVMVRLRSNSVAHTWAEAAFVINLVLLPLPWLLVLVACVEFLVFGWPARSVLKGSVNAAVSVLGAAAGGAVLHVLHPGPVAEPGWRAAGALLLAGLAYELVGMVATATVVSTAQGSRLSRLLLDGQPAASLFVVGNIVIGLAVLGLAAWRGEAVLLLPVALLALRTAYHFRVRVRETGDAWEQLERATRALNHLDEHRVLAALVSGADRLFRVDLVEVALAQDDGTVRTAYGTRDGLLSGTEGDAPPLPAGTTTTVPLEASEQVVGELRLHWDGPVRLSDQEQQALSTLASAGSAALLNARLHQQTVRDATQDLLTELPNRRYLLTQARRVVRDGGEPAALLLVDLDRFKEVNDTLGHAAGDALLRQVAATLRGCVRPGDTVSRLGGDEFAVLLPDTLPRVAREIAERMVAALTEPVFLEGVVVPASGSVGVACAPDDATDVEELLRCADVAMYQAKRAGGGVQRYDATRDGRDLVQLSIEPDLRAALDRQDIDVWYQPQVDLRTGRLVSAEALLRWHHPVHGLLSPAVFLPMAERRGLADRLLGHVLRSSLAARREWLEQAGLDIPIAVNLSPRNLLDPTTPRLVAEAVAAHDVPPGRLVLEVPETMALGDLDTVAEMLAALRESGAELSLDDVGTGSTPLTLLTRTALSEVKIDRSFVGAMDRSDTDAAVVRAIIDLGRSLGLRVVAEGVETAWQAARLRDLGCHLGQGYLYSRAVSAADLPLTVGRQAPAPARPAAAGAEDLTGRVLHLPGPRRRSG